MTSSTLTVARKADRAVMAAAIHDLAVGLGCEAKVRVGAKGDFPDERTTLVGIQAPGGLCISVELSGSCSLKDQHLLHWNMAHDSEKLLVPGFAPSMNTVHYCKATDVARGFPDLLALLKARLSAAVDGSAYMDPDAAAAHKAQSKKNYDAMVARSRRMLDAKEPAAA